MTLDVGSVLWGAGVTAVLFLFSWGTKHVLDRVVLPRLLDWWAARTRARALRRAQRILLNFEHELACYADIRMLLYRTDSRMRATIFSLLFSALAATGVFTNTRLHNFVDSGISSLILGSGVNVGMIILVIILLLSLLMASAFVLWVLVGRSTLDDEMIISPGAVAARTLERIGKLLRAAGLTNTEQDAWRKENAKQLIAMMERQYIRTPGELDNLRNI